MADDPLFTLKQLAEQLGLPESTVRYYRDAFLDHIPSVGTGRRRRYPAQAIAVLRTIATQYASGKSRTEIVGAVEHGEGAPVHLPTARAESRGVEEVSNLDLLAAILDGEREQRDALWQMAKEIVRLTEVLEGQDKVLGEIADKAGVVVGGPAPLAAGDATPRLTAPLRPAFAEAAPPPPPPPPPPPQPPPPPPPPPPPHPAEPAPAPWWQRTEAPERPPHEPTAPRVVGGHDDMERLRAELESERQLVERLRTSKLQLEHRVVDAEATLEDRRREKRPSVLRRLLGSDDAP